MRILKICRTKRMEASMAKLIVEIDGSIIGKLSNGKELSASIDEQTHELYIHGGKFAGKAFATKLMIPAGSYPYSFQIDMLPISSGGNFKPVLLPCGGAPMANASRVIVLLVAALTAALLDPKLREALTKMPGAQLQLILGQQQWTLDVCVGVQRKTVLAQPYSQSKGSLIALAINGLEHADLQTPEGRMKLTNQIFDGYLNHLPDYDRTGPNALALKP